MKSNFARIGAEQDLKTYNESLLRYALRKLPASLDALENNSKIHDIERLRKQLKAMREECSRVIVRVGKGKYTDQDLNNAHDIAGEDIFKHIKDTFSRVRTLRQDLNLISKDQDSQKDLTIDEETTSIAALTELIEVL